MNYFLIALITTSGTAVGLYFLLNNIFHIRIKVVPLILCGACSLFVSIALPKVIVRYFDWLSTLGVLAVFSLIFAYFLAYYDEKFDSAQEAGSETALCLCEPLIQDGVSATLFTPEQDLVSSEQNLAEESNHYITSGIETAAPSDLPSCSQEQDSLWVEAISANEDFSILETFDEQLELAFHLKEQQDYRSAAKLFQKVLDANPHSEAVPLMILQIADSLKHAKEYRQAIGILSGSLNFPAIHGNIVTERQIYDLLAKMQQLQESEETGG